MTIEQQKEIWYLDIVKFSQDVFGEHIQPAYGVPDFHKEIYSLLLRDNPKWTKYDRLKVIQAPREHSKTTLVSLVYMLYNVLFKRKEFIVLICESFDQAQLILERARRELEDNPKIIKYFGRVGVKFGKDELGRWRTNELITNTGIRIRARGAGQKIRSFISFHTRPDLTIIDDLESELNTNTPEQIIKTRHWFMRAVIPALDLIRGELVYIFTPTHHDCLGLRLMKDDNWKSLYFDCYKDGDNESVPLWPEKFPIRVLKKIKRNFENQGDLTGWYMEYRGKVMSPEDEVFKREDFQVENYEYQSEEGQGFVQIADGKRHPVGTYVGVDLGGFGRSAGGDNTVFAVGGCDPENNIRVLEYRRGRYQPDEVINFFFQINSVYNRPVFSVETNAFQTLLFNELRREMAKRNQWLTILETHETQNKEARIRSLQPRFRAKTIYVRPEMTSFMEEFIQFPKARHDDVPDAFQKLVRVAQPARQPKPKPDISIFEPERVKRWPEERTKERMWTLT